MECSGSCPYLNGRDIWELIRERDALREKVSQMEALMSLAEVKIRELTEENKRLKEENSNLLHRNELKEVLKESISLWNEFKNGIIGIEDLKKKKIE